MHAEAPSTKTAPFGLSLRQVFAGPERQMRLIACWCGISTLLGGFLAQRHGSTPVLPGLLAASLLLAVALCFWIVRTEQARAAASAAPAGAPARKGSPVPGLFAEAGTQMSLLASGCGLSILLGLGVSRFHLTGVWVLPAVLLTSFALAAGLCVWNARGRRHP